MSACAPSSARFGAHERNTIPVREMLDDNRLEERMLEITSPQPPHVLLAGFPQFGAAQTFDVIQ